MDNAPVNLWRRCLILLSAAFVAARKAGGPNNERHSPVPPRGPEYEPAEADVASLRAWAHNEAQLRLERWYLNSDRDLVPPRNDKSAHIGKGVLLSFFTTRSFPQPDPAERKGICAWASRNSKFAYQPHNATFTEYNITGVRPVDVFNVLSECNCDRKRCPWNGANTSLSCQVLESDEGLARQALGLRIAGHYSFAEKFFPLESTSWQWAYVSGNLSDSDPNEEFLLVSSSRDTDGLLERNPMDPLTQPMEACFAATRISPLPDRSGVRVIAHMHADMVDFKLGSKEYEEYLVAKAEAIRFAARKQYRKGWGPNETMPGYPRWILAERGCVGLSKESPYRTDLLAYADSEFGKGDSLKKLENRVVLYPDGSTVEVSIKKGLATCGDDLIWNVVEPSPIRRLEFEVPYAKPLEVFAVLAGVMRAPDWNSRFIEVRPNDIRGGARGFFSTKNFPTGPEANPNRRATNEWQVARHVSGNSSWTLASRSWHVDMGDIPQDNWVFNVTDDSRSSWQALEAQDGPERGIIATAEEASNCLSVYSMRPSRSGTKLIMQEHVNPNLLDEAGLLYTTGLAMDAAKLVEQLLARVFELRALRGNASALSLYLDEGIIGMLVPDPSIGDGIYRPTSLVEVIDAAPPEVVNGSGQFRYGGNISKQTEKFLSLFATMNISAAVNISARGYEFVSDNPTGGSFPLPFDTCALELRTLFALVSREVPATLEESGPFGHQAQDGLDLLEQGQALGWIQARVAMQLNATCVGAINPSPTPLPASHRMQTLLAFGIVVSGVIGCFFSSCLGEKARRRRRARRQAAIATEEFGDLRDAHSVVRSLASKWRYGDPRCGDISTVCSPTGSFSLSSKYAFSGPSVSPKMSRDGRKSSDTLASVA